MNALAMVASINLRCASQYVVRKGTERTPLLIHSPLTSTIPILSIREVHGVSTDGDVNKELRLASKQG